MVSQRSLIGMRFVLATYCRLASNPERAPIDWRASCANSESSIHQLSPYIGKLKSSIASDLIDKYSEPGNLVVDPFCGSGTIPVEAVRKGRRVWAADINPYSQVLTRGKLSAPSFEDALHQLERCIKAASAEPREDCRRIPAWVRSFFHTETLREAVAFARVCKRRNNYFLLSCLLGILHHQRPGFLSYPSSHLVPYLRDKKYPRDQYPELYGFRPIAPRLKAKVERAYKRPFETCDSFEWLFRRGSVGNLTFPDSFDALISSPPYMNALDYVRDNRLRLWFTKPESLESKESLDASSFRRLISCLGRKIESGLRSDGMCVLVVGRKGQTVVPGCTL